MRLNKIILLCLIPIFIISRVFLNYNWKDSATITSTYIRAEWAVADLPLHHKAFAAPQGYNAPQQVHITQGDYDGKAAIISWLTPDEPGSSKVQYGMSEDEFEFTAEGTFSNYSFFKYKSGYIHHCLLDALKYDTKYYYKIGSGVSARQFWFQTPPKISPDSSYKFGIMGDLGQTHHSLSTLEHYLESVAQTVLFVGDLCYADRYQHIDVGVRWDTWGRLVERITAYQPWIWCTGNHDIEYIPDLGLNESYMQFNARYPTPYKYSHSKSPLWYAIRRGPAHIIILSSYSGFVKHTPQHSWLEEELKKVDRKKTPWLIVLMHIPLYNSNVAHYMEGESMRSVFEQWFITYKVDVIFAGHVHSYERTGCQLSLVLISQTEFLDGYVLGHRLSWLRSGGVQFGYQHRVSNVKYNISNGVCSPELNEAGPVYITIGDGGNSEGIAGEYIHPQPNYSAFREASFGHAILDIKNRTHAYHYWHRNQDGYKVTGDSFVLHNQYWKS